MLHGHGPRPDLHPSDPQGPVGPSSLVPLPLPRWSQQPGLGRGPGGRGKGKVPWGICEAPGTEGCRPLEEGVATSGGVLSLASLTQGPECPPTRSEP